MGSGVLSKITTTTGGLLYHVRAAMNKKRWQPFCDFVEDWLLSWPHPPFSRLVLVGPNAGYTLPAAFIRKFSQVVVIEPDPLAWAMFEARLRAGSVSVRQDYFGLSQKTPDPQKVRDLFTAFPKSVFLFCNILGQLPILLREAQAKRKSNPNEIQADIENLTENYMAGLAKVLHEMSAAHCVASYHDRYSRNWRKPDVIVDHMTKGLFPQNLRRKEFPWKLTKRLEHQIEFVRTDG